MPLSQRHRTLSVTTPLGEDILLLRAMSGKEHLSTLFEYELELISKYDSIQHEELLGQPVTVQLELPNYRTRYFNGIVSRFSHIGFDGSLAIYQATLVPWLWFLSRTSDCRIFQDQTVPDIVKDIFREHGYTDFEEFLVEPHQRRNYCVQYRETDFDFISRLLEQEGIYYFFRHRKDRHTLVLTDDYGAHRPIAGYEEIPYYPPDETALRERDHISGWSVAGAVQSGVFVHTDFDYTAPRKDLLTMVHHPHEHARADLERYDYPGGYTQRDQGDDWARARIEELHVDYETVKGSGNARGLATGSLFTLTKYPRDDQNREYLIVSTEYKLQSDAFGSSGEIGGTASTGPVFQCWFTALDAQTPYRPPRITPKARVQGPQTAIVVGKSGQEIRTDQYGRVKVQFHWDRYGKSDEHSSCWVRVAQLWAGKNWGAMAVPRIGQEVIVDFLEGDPDRPIITGRVYNGVNKPPYGLPAGPPSVGSCPTAPRAAVATTNTSWTIPRATNSSVSMVNSTKTAPSNTTCASMCSTIAVGMSPITRPSKSVRTAPRPSATMRPPASVTTAKKPLPTTKPSTSAMIATRPWSIMRPSASAVTAPKRSAATRP